MIKVMSKGNNQPIICGVMVNSLADIWLNNGKNAQATNTAMMAPASVTIIDSVRNCAIKYLRGEPSTLRTPTSFALLDERAVDRFIKFTQAISSINIAMAEKI